MKKVLSLMVAVAVVVMAASALAGIKNSKHDLSSTNPAIATSPTEQVCVFCHTPHNAQIDVPLWNRTASEGTFSLYSSGSMENRPARTFQADSVSLLCMSCHDGGALAGGVVNHSATEDWTIQVSNDETNYPEYNIAADKITGNANLGEDLTNDHPVGFQVTNGTKLNNLVVGKSVGKTDLPLYKGGYFECASCHAVHDNTYAPFLRRSNDGSALCLDCHNK